MADVHTHQEMMRWLFFTVQLTVPMVQEKPTFCGDHFVRFDWNRPQQASVSKAKKGGGAFGRLAGCAGNG